MGATEKRPRGRPAKPDTTVINLRIPRGLLERLDRYIDSEMRWHPTPAVNRATVMREALEAFVSKKGYLTHRREF